MASSCEMLALRFMGFRSIFVIFKILQRPLSVRGLFFARRYRREAIRIPWRSSRNRHGRPVPTDSYLEYTLMQRMAVAQVPDSDPVDSGRISRLYAGRNCKSDFSVFGSG